MTTHTTLGTTTGHPGDTPPTLTGHPGDTPAITTGHHGDTADTTTIQLHGDTTHGDTPPCTTGHHGGTRAPTTGHTTPGTTRDTMILYHFQPPRLSPTRPSGRRPPTVHILVSPP